MQIQARGFALIELVLGIAISSIVGITLYTIINQIYRSESYVSDTISVGMRLALVQERLQRDLTGMVLLSEVKKPEALPSADPANKYKPAPGSKMAEVEQFLQARKNEGKTDQAEPAVESIPPVENQLISSSQDDGQGAAILKELTFLTVNPLQVYGEIKPRIVRVIYTLQPEVGVLNSWSLFRQEATDLDLRAVKNNPELTNNYLLVSGIKKLVFTYHLMSAEGEPQQVVNLEQEQPTELPKYVEIDLDLWQDARQKEVQTFKFWYMPIRPVAESKKLRTAEGTSESTKQVVKPVKGEGPASAKI